MPIFIMSPKTLKAPSCSQFKPYPVRSAVHVTTFLDKVSLKAC
uniref:Uncharacterized protein n=1 Tax=Rhizophora mucronata TaxID=61149 RepID=A0A2P2Q7M0_RHIMU